MRQNTAEKRPRCERCLKPISPHTTVWLELSQTDGRYYEQVPEGHVSQGAFYFGSHCAAMQLAETDNATKIITHSKRLLQHG